MISKLPYLLGYKMGCFPFEQSESSRSVFVLEGKCDVITELYYKQECNSHRPTHSTMRKRQSNTMIHTLIHRGSYMSAHVLLNLLNELGKRDKIQGFPSILSLFRNKFNKFNNTRAWVLDSIYHMGLDARKTVFRGLRTTKAQTRLRIPAVWSAPLLFTFWKVSYINLLQAKFQFSS